MTIEQEEYKSVEASFRAVFQHLAPRLSAEAAQNVEHYLDVAEIEMACESLVLSLAEEKIFLQNDTKEELVALCLGLRLDKESVFRADFWAVASAALIDPK